MADESKAATEFEFYTPMFRNGQLHPLLVRMLDKTSLNSSVFLSFSSILQCFVMENIHPLLVRMLDNRAQQLLVRMFCNGGYTPTIINVRICFYPLLLRGVTCKKREFAYSFPLSLSRGIKD